MTGCSRRLLSAVLLCAILVLGTGAPVHGQDISDLPAVTDTYALEGARVVQAPGQVIESATVVVDDGIISAVGSDVTVPYDARRIAADSLVVYAGFLDGLSHAGVEMPENKDGNDDNGDDVDPGDPPPDRAGIQPNRAVRPFLTPEESHLEGLRKIGFTAGHVAPEGDMLPGQSAVILYGGDTASDMLLENEPALFAQMQTASGYVYPATDMAVIAKFRQLYREAERRQQLEAEYRRNQVGTKRPPRDPVHSALFSVVDGDKPLFFYADEALSLHRVLDLHRELEFPLVLAGLAESRELVDALTGAEAPLFLTLDLPEAPTRSAKADTIIADTTDMPSRYYDPEFRSTSYADMDDEEQNLELRHAMARQNRLATAASLHDAGLEFGFTTRDVKPGDIRKNLRTMIDAGLPEQTALAALTTQPASLLGVEERLGTVEEGKIANLVVTDGPYFSEDAKVTHVFVDGQLHDYQSEKESGTVSGNVSAVVGTWTYTLETPQGDLDGTLTIEGDQSGLEGTFTGPRGESQDLQSVSFDGSTLSFSLESPQGADVSVTVTVEEGSFEGTASTAQGSFPITGERTDTPDGS